MSNSQEESEVTLDLTIEALTGTVYDLCVSPYETILGIKTKIQNLEGIPVYQQQLVYGSHELQDEFCLAEYAIPTGAQLKLLVAMRGGPIHAQRVHLDLEDPALMEIAQFLDSRDKYTVMLVRDGEELVRVQVAEDSCESLSCSPVHMSSEPHKRSSPSHQESAEHDVMRDKVKDLMAKLKKGRSYRQPIHHKPASKVLILESRASSRLLANSSRGSPLQSGFNEPHRLSTAQRHLVFSKEDRSSCHCMRGTRSQRLVRGVPSHTSGEETPQVSKKHYPRVSQGDMTDSRAAARPPHEHKRSSRRSHRNIQSDRDQQANTRDPLTELSQQMSQLDVEPRQPFLPSLSTAPVSLTAQPKPPVGKLKQKNRCMHCSKRVGLASTYHCRCGGLFCAAHRYAEAHSCSFNYKEEGRRLLSRNNPVVTAPKLPKI